MMYAEKEQKTSVQSELDGDMYLGVVVDHLDNENTFEFKTNIEERWISRDDLLEIKRVIDKALRDHKNGFKA